MAGRRSKVGTGNLSLIYTVGSEDPHVPQAQPGPEGKYLTASIGEDFADCRWPVTVKAKPDVTPRHLGEYLTALTTAIRSGFFMDPSMGSAIYWRWTGIVPPGLEPDDPDLTETAERSIEQALGTGQRSPDGKGTAVGIYLMDDAFRWSGDGFYGKIRGETAISGCVDEDFAASSWPLVVKSHSDVGKDRLLRYLSDLADSVKDGFFFAVSKEKPQKS